MPRPDAIVQVSHNLKGPLTALRVAAASLAEGNEGRLPRQARATAQLMERTAARLIRIIEIQLDASRPKPAVRASSDLRAELQEIIAILKPLAALKHLSLTLQMPSGSLPRLNAERISHIAFVLIDNAIAYTQKGKITVTVRADRKMFTVSVADTGIGLQEGEMKQLFRPYRQESRGNGVGLFLARRFAMQLKGALTAQSAGVGKGSTFILRIPLKPK